MHLSIRTTSALLSALTILTLACANASASPTTVNLRVEGSSSTLFEGPVAAEAVPAPGITTKTSPEPHACDFQDNGSNGGFGGALATSTAALYEAASAARLPFDAKWSSSLSDFEVTQVGPDIAGGPPNYESWGYAINNTTANFGGCQIALAPGNEVLWAYNYFNLAHVLRASGSAQAGLGVPFAVHVVDARTGEPLAEATIGEDVGGATTPLPGSPKTDAAGNATVTLAHTGQALLKATRAESVRSNGLPVCVHAGSDGNCGTSAPGTPAAPGGSQPLPVTPSTLDSALASGVLGGHVYSRRLAPRVLRGAVRVPQGGTLREVRIRLERRYAGRCFSFSGARERFVRTRCGGARLFSVGSSESFSYLLPAALPPGRYVYDVVAVDDAGHQSTLRNGLSHLVFRVR